MDMRSQNSRIRSCLAIFHALGMFVALAGCQADRGSGLPPLSHVLHGGPSSGNVGYAPGAPCSGFHPTVWQTWHEGSMAILCNQGEATRFPSSTA